MRDTPQRFSCIIPIIRGILCSNPSNEAITAKTAIRKRIWISKTKKLPEMQIKSYSAKLQPRRISGILTGRKGNHYRIKPIAGTHQKQTLAVRNKKSQTKPWRTNSKNSQWCHSDKMEHTWLCRHLRSYLSFWRISLTCKIKTNNPMKNKIYALFYCFCLLCPILPMQNNAKEQPWKKRSKLP